MISIIVPVYNVKPYLGKCLQSVKLQSYRDWECIVVDDGSTDGSDEELHKIIGGDKRFTILHYENAGLPVARNRGIAKAKGESLFFLDSDDWIERNALDILASQAEMNPDVGRIVGLDFIHWERCGWNGLWSISPSGFHAPDSKWLFSSSSCDVGHCTACLYVRKNIPCEIIFPKVRIFEDMIFNMGLMFAGMTTYVTKSYIYHYIRRDGTLVESWLTEEQAATIRKALEDLAERYSPSPTVYERCRAFLENALRGRLENSPTLTGGGAL